MNLHFNFHYYNHYSQLFLNPLLLKVSLSGPELMLERPCVSWYIRLANLLFHTVSFVFCNQVLSGFLCFSFE